MGFTKVDVVKATVDLLKKGGHGVLVNDNLIVTAAHCIEFECRGRMTLGDYYIEHIKTTQGELKVAPLAVEPVSDVAVLGSLDGQVSKDFYDESVAFESFCDTTKPVPLCLNEFELFQKIPVYIYSHEGKWISGSAIQNGPNDQILWIEPDEPIQGGASGGPIINESGELVGIVSISGGSLGEGPAPRPHLALPVWVVRRICERG